MTAGFLYLPKHMASNHYCTLVPPMKIRSHANKHLTATSCLENFESSGSNKTGTKKTFDFLDFTRFWLLKQLTPAAMVFVHLALVQRHFRASALDFITKFFCSHRGHKVRSICQKSKLKPLNKKDKCNTNNIFCFSTYPE